MPGAGNSSAGNTDAGFGDINFAVIPGADVFRDPFSTKHLSSRRIDPKTRDYVINATGQILGMTRAQQFVELAMGTDKGSCVLSDVGQQLRRIQKITSNFVTQVTSEIRSALSEGVNEGLISITAITVLRTGTTGAYANIRWTDLTNFEENETNI